LRVIRYMLCLVIRFMSLNRHIHGPGLSIHLITGIQSTSFSVFIPLASKRRGEIQSRTSRKDLGSLAQRVQIFERMLIFSAKHGHPMSKEEEETSSISARDNWSCTGDDTRRTAAPRTDPLYTALL